MMTTVASLTAQEIAALLNERNVALIERILEVLGPERAEAILENTLQLEAEGGLRVVSRRRRRTPGGVFFYIVKRTTPLSWQRRIFPADELARFAPPRPRARARPAPVPRRPWQDLQPLIRAYTDPWHARATMKLTLIGRPFGTKTQGQVVLFQLQGTPPANLPKELPALPEHTPITWTVMLSLRQWNKVKGGLAKDRTDKLVLEGYPLLDGDTHVMLANSCISVAMQRAQKEQQRAAANASS